MVDDLIELELDEPVLHELTGELDFIDPYIDEVQWERNYDY